MKRLAALSGLTLLLGCGLAQPTQLKEWHPRLFVVGDNQTECLTHHADVVQAIQTGKYQDAWALALASTSEYNGNQFKKDLLRSLLDSSFAQAEVAEAKAFVASSDYYPNHFETLWLFLMFDWFRDQWDTIETQALIDYAHQMVTQNQWTNRNILNNHFHEDRALQRTMPGLALGNEGIDVVKEAWLWERAQYWARDQLITAYDAHAGSYGACPEGNNYWVRGYPALMLTAIAWTSATDSRFFDSNWAHFPKAALYLWRPYDGRLVPWSDSIAGLGRIGESDTYLRLGYSSRTVFNYFLPLMRWNNSREAAFVYSALADIPEPLTDPLGSSSYSDIFSSYIFFDGLSPQQDPLPVDLESLDLASFFDGYGGVVLREGWEDSHVLFTYKQNRQLCGHDHLDAGSFTIDRGAPLAIDSGYYSSNGNVYDDQTGEYYARTLAHNGVTVLKPDQVVHVQWWPEATGLPNVDGGQHGPTSSSERRPTTYEDSLEEQWNRGQIYRYWHDATDVMTYFIGDVSAAYFDDSVQSYTRSIFSPDHQMFVILDRVASQDASYEKRWLLHCVNEPQMEGSLLSSDPGQGSANYSGQDFVISNGPSHLFVRMLLPQNNNLDTLRVRGGEDFAFWTTYDGTGENATARRPPEGVELPGQYRVEEKCAGELESVFLNVLFAVDQTVLDIGNVALLPSDSNLLVVHLNDRVAIFSRAETIHGTGLSSGSYTCPAGIDFHIAFDLIANRRYQILKNGSPFTQQSSDENALIRFTNTSAEGDVYALSALPIAPFDYSQWPDVPNILVQWIASLTP